MVEVSSTERYGRHVLSLSAQYLHAKSPRDSFSDRRAAVHTTPPPPGRSSSHPTLECQPQPPDDCPTKRQQAKLALICLAHDLTVQAGARPSGHSLPEIPLLRALTRRRQNHYHHHHKLDEALSTPPTSPSLPIDRPTARPPCFCNALPWPSLDEPPSHPPCDAPLRPR